MTDREIIQGLIDRDNQITDQFFYVKCRPLLTAIIRIVFDRYVDYDEKVSDLYDYLMEDDCFKLRQFQYRSSIFQWMKVVATRFFLHERKKMIENSPKEPPFEGGSSERIIDPANEISERMDVANLLQLIDNQRYVDVIRNLVLRDVEPVRYAEQIGVTVDNLYNIKKRAMAALTRIAIKYYGYGR